MPIPIIVGAAISAGMGIYNNYQQKKRQEDQQEFQRGEWMSREEAPMAPPSQGYVFKHGKGGPSQGSYINIEKGEIGIDEKGRILEDYMDNRFSKHSVGGREATNNTIRTKSDFIIPAKFAKTYKEGDKITKRGIIRQVALNAGSPSYVNKKGGMVPKYGDGGSIPSGGGDKTRVNVFGRWITADNEGLEKIGQDWFYTNTDGVKKKITDPKLADFFNSNRPEGQYDYHPGVSPNNYSMRGLQTAYNAQVPNQQVANQQVPNQQASGSQTLGNVNEESFNKLPLTSMENAIKGDPNYQENIGPPATRDVSYQAQQQKQIDLNLKNAGIYSGAEGFGVGAEGAEGAEVNVVNGANGGQILDLLGKYGPTLFNFAAASSPVETFDPIYNKNQEESLGILKDMNVDQSAIQNRVNRQRALADQQAATGASNSGALHQRLRQNYVTAANVSADVELQSQQLNNQYKGNYAEALNSFGQQNVQSDYINRASNIETRTNRTNFLTSAVSGLSASYQNEQRNNLLEDLVFNANPQLSAIREQNRNRRSSRRSARGKYGEGGPVKETKMSSELKDSISTYMNEGGEPGLYFSDNEMTPLKDISYSSGRWFVDKNEPPNYKDFLYTPNAKGKWQMRYGWNMKKLKDAFQHDDLGRPILINGKPQVNPEYLKRNKMKPRK